MITRSRQSGTRWMPGFALFIFGCLWSTAALAQPDLMISNIAPGASELRLQIRPFASALGYSVEGLRPTYTVQNQGTAPSGSFQVLINVISCRPRPHFLGQVGGGPP